MWQAEAHARTILFREETRWPGYYFRSDNPTLDEANWKVFVELHVQERQLGIQEEFRSFQ